jgi:hypothetical protein
VTSIAIEDRVLFQGARLKSLSFHAVRLYGKASANDSSTGTVEIAIDHEMEITR